MKYSSLQEISEAIGKVRYYGGVTNTSGALSDIRTVMSEQGRLKSKGVPRIGIMVTDGK